MSDEKSISLTPPPVGYNVWLGDIKAQIHEARQRASQALNLELVVLYWSIGKAILDRQERQGWGARVIDRLSHDLRANFPEMKGFSPRNLKYMRAFAEAWPGSEIVQEAPGPLESGAIVQQPLHKLAPGQMVQGPLAETDREPFVQQAAGQIVQAPLHNLTSGEGERSPQAHQEGKRIVQQLLHKLPWYHHIALLDKLQTAEDRLWYAAKALEHNWSRNVLVMQIESRLRERSGSAVTNFALTLPKPQSDLARECFKDPYRFDFLGLTEEAQEREIEKALVKHVTNFLLELGAGFAFVGKQVRLDVGGEEFFMDLLFYHLKLRCYVVIELKAGKFKPEHLGQLSFYLTTVDAQVKHEQDGPTIGLLLCKSKTKVVAEYALRGNPRPLGVAEYQLVESLPPELRTSLPSIEQIERELAGEDEPFSDEPS